jgi:anti-anti-sigma factor
VTGEIDLASSGWLTREIEAAVAMAAEAPDTSVVVDLSKVSFLDSSGINALITGSRLAGGAGHFRVTGATGFVREVLEFTGVWGHLGGEQA